jgi:hypothetical protein
MEKDVAERLMHLLRSVEEPLNEAAALIEQISDAEEKRELRRGIGEIMGRTFTDVVTSIIRQYPELDPDKDADWLRELRSKRGTPNE